MEVLQILGGGALKPIPGHDKSNLKKFIISFNLKILQIFKLFVFGFHIQLM